ncbi:hypothetical protein ACTPEF_26915, partial [Clostridioides difficile]
FKSKEELINISIKKFLKRHMDEYKATHDTKNLAPKQQLREILATNGKLIYGDYNDCVSDIVIDSREANAQNAFVAIVGENLDG